MNLSGCSLAFWIYIFILLFQLCLGFLFFKIYSCKKLTHDPIVPFALSRKLDFVRVLLSHCSKSGVHKVRSQRFSQSCSLLFNACKWWCGRALYNKVILLRQNCHVIYFSFPFFAFSIWNSVQPTATFPIPIVIAEHLQSIVDHECAITMKCKKGSPAVLIWCSTTMYSCMKHFHLSDISL